MGLPAYVACRHRWIDERIQEALDQGAEHVLVLGAGYDSRAWRLSRTVPLTELDHPATQARKLRCAETLAPPNKVQHAPIDFESTPLQQRMVALDWKPRRTAIVWEGVSMYLTLNAVQSTLSTLAQATSSGSLLAMDWMAHNDAPTWRGTFDRVAPQVLHLVGEPVTLAVPPQAISGIVEPCGWSVDQLATATDLSQVYNLGSRPIYGPGTVSLLRRH